MKLLNRYTPYVFVSIVSTLFSTASIAAAKDDPLLSLVRINQLEVRNGDEDPDVLEAEAWLGYDLHKFWIKTDIERVDNTNERAELQLLYSKAVDPNWDLQIGLRRDFDPEPERNWAVIGFQGLAQYNVEIDAAFFVGESGRTALRFEAEYELLLSRRWVLIPELELNFFGKTDEETETGSGLADSELGLRLAYVVRREFTPYIGVNWERSYGRTADFAEENDESTNDVQLVVGFRAWF